ncbi:hypothetical protein DFP93_106174 [Aneurinibacillus soli]|uniref:Uncharacterized protein n=1 Tax=Aneurinibacillus soli TaxID=1500254 RepID=A0A0U5B520_9BACL|nr:hypothetical protein [Aneurinibacillus soli]PYE61979.1 hypothetical protein DFP93_106174 [Aneurinibacillus soli]BAU29794.1 hypothetical protein CB4_04031 [Aneurinibacillus soli]
MNELLLQQILEELKGLKDEQQGLRQEIIDTRKTMATKEDTSDIRQTMATKEDVSDIPLIKQAVAEINERTKVIEQSVRHLEENEPADVLAMLDRIDQKLEEKDSEITVLNNRLFKVESTAERLRKQ